MKFLTHRDPVHGDVRLDPLATELLNTPVLQRLGRVYQLGYAHLVYRGGTHTRLSHVMGAAHVAGRLVDLLRQNYVDGADRLEEVERLAERGPAGPLLADVYLTRARLHVVQAGAVVGDDLTKARRLIRSLGYSRRLLDLEHAEAVLAAGAS